jgi:hypothetical protein
LYAGRKEITMKLIDLWKLGDLAPFKMFIKCDDNRKEVLDGPGFPVVDGRDASDLEIESIRPAAYPMYGPVLEVVQKATPAMGKRRFPGYGLLEYLPPAEYFNGDIWQYESTEDCTAGTTWDIVSRKDSPVYDCRYTTIIRN